MGESAQVRSVQAIDAFRSRLLVYAAKARPLIDDARDEVARTREWIRADRRVHWENELRKRKRQLEQAEQALFSARFSTLRQVTAAEQLSVQRARRAVDEAEEKLKRIKRWSVNFDEQTGPLLKQLEQLRTLITSDLVKGASYINEVLQKLSEYAEVRPLSGTPEPAPLPKEEKS